MKKQFISFFLTLVVLVVIASCGSKTSNQQAEPASTEQMTVDTSGSSQPVAAVYQCPMKCEGEKTYDKPGKCPKCSMDLKAKDEHEGHEH
jgi:Cu2+-exporting ATPase